MEIHNEFQTLSLIPSIIDSEKLDWKEFQLFLMGILIWIGHI